MIPLLIPWLIVVFAVITVVLVVLRKWEYALLFLVVCVALNWWAKCFPIHICSKGENRECLKVMTFNINGTIGDISKKAPKLAELINKYNPDILFVSELSDKNKLIMDSLFVNIFQYTTHTKNCWNCFYSKSQMYKWGELENNSNIEHLGVYICHIPFANDSIIIYGCHFESNNYTTDNKYLTPDSINNHHEVITYLSNVKRTSVIRNKEANAVSGEIMKSIHPVILMGDLNDVCGSTAVRTLERAGLSDAWWVNGCGYGATIHRPLPFRIDHIMFSDRLRLQHIEVVNSKGLSDHDALYAEFKLNYLSRK